MTSNDCESRKNLSYLHILCNLRSFFVGASILKNTTDPLFVTKFVSPKFEDVSLLKLMLLQFLLFCRRKQKFLEHYENFQFVILDQIFN